MALETFRVLRNRDYALLWWTGLVSNAGTWMQGVAVGALVTELTGKASWGAFAVAVSFGVAGLITPLGGVLADRHSRRRLLLYTALIEAAVAFALAILYIADLVSPAVLVINVAIEGFLVALALPAHSAMMPDLVPRDQVADGAALGNASWNLGRIVGPAIGGLILALGGTYSWIFVINAISFLFVAIAMVFVRVPPLKVVTTGTVWQRLRDGFAGARSEPGCLSSIRMIAIVALTVSPFIALMPAMAQIVFKGSAIDTSHLVIAQGLGSVVGSIALAPLARRYGRHRSIIAALIALPIVEILYSQAPTVDAAVVGSFFLGVTYVGVLVGMNVVVQLRAPAHLRARTLGIYFMTLSLGYPVGASLQGWVADQVGLRSVLFAGPTLFLIALAAMAMFRPEWLRSLDASSAPGVTATTVLADET